MINSLPDVPNRTDSPSDFTQKTDALLSALPTFINELNQLALQFNTNIGTVFNAAVRQCAQTGLEDSNGQASFVTAGTGLSVNISATAENITIHAAGGAPHNDRIGVITADTTLSGLTPNAINYIYADIAANGTVTLGATTLAPNYIQGGTPSTTNNQFTFLIGKMKGYLGNGSLASQVFRVFLAKATTGASSVTNVSTFAKNGYYDSNLFPTNTNTAYPKSHNLGLKSYKTEIRYADDINGLYERTGNVAYGSSGGLLIGYWLINASDTSITVNTASTNTGFNGTGTSSNASNPYYRVICKREW